MKLNFQKNFFWMFKCVLFYFIFFLVYLCVWFFFLIFIFTLFYFTILYWFCHTLTWIHHGCTCDPCPVHSMTHNLFFCVLLYELVLYFLYFHQLKDTLCVFKIQNVLGLIFLLIKNSRRSLDFPLQTRKLTCFGFSWFSLTYSGFS